ncbi:MAG: hypothetical protein ACOY16_11715 [Chloroflexota bacterium]
MKAGMLGLCLIFLMACSLTQPARVVDEADFRFTLPPGWRLMSELWENYTPGNDYKHLGVAEIVSVTSVQKKGEYGVWFTVAQREFSGSDLRAELDQLYRQTEPSIPDFTLSEAEIGGYAGYVVTYRRPWGEPWWEFQDYWVVKGGRVYLLSFEALKLDEYAEEMQLIRDSFVWK